MFDTRPCCEEEDEGFWGTGAEGASLSLGEVTGLAEVPCAESLMLYEKEELALGGWLPVPEDDGRRKSVLKNLIDFGACNQPAMCQAKLHGYCEEVEHHEPLDRRTREFSALARMLEGRAFRSMRREIFGLWRDVVDDVKVQAKLDKIEQENVKLKVKLKKFVNFLAREPRI
uniref:Uncharacterized protein n=1 Tax=Noctiluca scintillans TaxID=2966 RepID=A0A7S0ZS92_NOCSC